MRTDTPTLQAYRKQYETAKALGAAMLACNAVMVFPTHPELYILVQNFPRPAITHNDPADVDYARGLKAHTQGTPQTNFEGNITMIETVSGQMAQFAEDVVNNHRGILDRILVYDGFVGDGSTIQGERMYELMDCAITFPDGGGEIDSASRSQILQVQGNINYNYFGDGGKLGTGTVDSTDVFANVLNTALKNYTNATNGTYGG